MNAGQKQNKTKQQQQNTPKPHCQLHPLALEKGKLRSIKEDHALSKVTEFVSGIIGAGPHLGS